MTKSLQSSMAPLFIISWFHCLGLFEYPLGQSRLHFSCLYALAVWSPYAYYRTTVYIYLWQHGFRFFCIMNSLDNLLSLSSIFISFNRCKELKACLRELSIVDNSLEALGVPKEYRMLRNLIIRIIIGWIAILFINLTVSIFLDSIRLNVMPILIIIYKIFWIILWPTNTDHVITLSTLICGTVLGYTSSRFHRVNERLQELYSDLFQNNYNCRSQNRFILVRQLIARDKYHKQYVWTLM
ncbi:hypothetical protein ALC62_05171 [Cyphomyrmex costatus]|uniref:Uncharacterized protein n=1 Tax=Cyphomyrmex costatus TaxID=456900 RepID=A0A151IJZ7_9HYME|nr:hypothetical protein ALC62_05171 [Cyphomyrmex costatus]